VSGAIVSFVLAGVCFALGRWGARQADQLVPASVSMPRREKDERSLRRGAKSCLVMAGLFAVLGVVSAASSMADAHTTL